MPHPVFTGPHYGTLFASPPFWHLEFLVGSHIFFLENVCTRAPTTKQSNPLPYGETAGPTVLSVTQCAALQPAGNDRLTNADRAVDYTQWQWCWADCVESINQDGQCTYDVTYRQIRVTTVALHKQWVLHILSVCLLPQVSSMQRACAVL